MLTAELKYTRIIKTSYLITKGLLWKDRENKLNHFDSLRDYSVPILDAGVSGYYIMIRKVNFFLDDFKFPSFQYTGLAVEPVNNLAAQHPDKTFIRYWWNAISFSIVGFYWFFSNAVIEHVGESDQLLFVNEMLRVSRNMFFFTPNKFFPVESHTNVFFIGLTTFL